MQDRGTFKSSQQTKIHTRTQVVSLSSLWITHRKWGTHGCLYSVPLLLSARVHAEELDALRAPVQADPGVEHQRPHVGDEEVLWLVLLHVFELELGEFLINAHAESERVTGRQTVSL